MQDTIRIKKKLKKTTKLSFQESISKQVNIIDELHKIGSQREINKL